MDNYPLCGHCLHNTSIHITFNHSGKYLVCGKCSAKGEGGLCPIEEFNRVHKATDANILYEMQGKREYSTYTPKEISS